MTNVTNDRSIPPTVTVAAVDEMVEVTMADVVVVVAGVVVIEMVTMVVVVKLVAEGRNPVLVFPDTLSHR